MWWTIGIFLVAGLVAFWFWLGQQKIKAPWYTLVLGITGMLLLTFALHNFTDFRAEHEMVAAWNSVIIFGIPALVLLCLAAFLVWFGEYKLKQSKSAAEVVDAP